MTKEYEVTIDSVTKDSVTYSITGHTENGQTVSYRFSNMDERAMLRVCKHFNVLSLNDCVGKKVTSEITLAGKIWLLDTELTHVTLEVQSVSKTKGDEIVIEFDRGITHTFYYDDYEHKHFLTGLFEVTNIYELAGETFQAELDGNTIMNL